MPLGDGHVSNHRPTFIACDTPPPGATLNPGTRFIPCGTPLRGLPNPKPKLPAVYIALRPGQPSTTRYALPEGAGGVRICSYADLPRELQERWYQHRDDDLVFGCVSEPDAGVTLPGVVDKPAALDVTGADDLGTHTASPSLGLDSPSVAEAGGAPQRAPGGGPA